MDRRTFLAVMPALAAGSCAVTYPRIGDRPKPGQPAGSGFRGLWVTRWDFRSVGDVRRAVDDAASLGITDLFWQSRGQADAFYKSAYEPWGRELFRDLPKGATAPSFDPLQTVCDAAKAKGIRVHAWVNVMPLWKGLEAPTDPNHLFNKQPKWRLHDQKGAPQPLNDHYVIVNPVLDDVHSHLVTVFRDIVLRYPVAGLHLDYVRFVSEKMDAATVYPGDAQSMAMFTKATGRRGLATSADKQAFTDWKRSRITDLVRRIKAEAVKSRDGVQLTAAVWARPDTAREQYLQDGVQWLKDGLLDRALPMIYTDDDAKFSQNLRAWTDAAPGAAISPGLGTYMHVPEQSPRQIDIARATPAKAHGVAIFAYSALFDSVDPSQRKDPKSAAERQQRRLRLAAYFKGEGAVQAPAPTDRSL